MCKSLVINAPDFSQKYSSKLDDFREKIAKNTCEELDLSYALSEVSNDNESDYYLSQLLGYHNDEYSESINQRKLTIINLARKTLREPEFLGSEADLNKYQFFGLCQSVVKNDMGNSQARLESYEDTISYIEESYEDTIPYNPHPDIMKNALLLDNENNPYILLYDYKESETNWILINLLSKEEVFNIDFGGSIVSVDENYNFITKFKYSVEIKNKIPVFFEAFYHNKKLKSQFKFRPDGAQSSARWWYINGSKMAENIYKDGFLSSVEEWIFNGELLRRESYKKGIPHGFHEFFVGGELRVQSSYKDGLKHGTETKWSWKGEGGTYLSEENNYLNDKLHGQSVSYFSDGKIIERINYNNGLKHGIHEYFGFFTEAKKVCYQNDVKVKLEICNPQTESHEQESLDVTAPEIEIVSLPVDTCEKPYQVVGVAPIYPRRALARGISGWVDLSYTVNETGGVENVVVVDSSDSMFDRAAIKAMEKWKFKPVFCNGELQKFDMTNRMNFDID